MLQLILWRHAEAEEGSPDLSRNLTAKGRKQAQKVAQFLQNRLPENREIWVSQANRSQQTAAYLGGDTVILPTLNPDIDAQTLPRLLQTCVDKKVLVIVGHQPWIGDLCAFLLNGNFEHERLWSVKKGAFWWFQVDFVDDDLRCKLKMVLNPNDI